MTTYRSDRDLVVEQFDWDSYTATLDVEPRHRDQYRIFPLDIPFSATEMECLRKGHESEDMGDHWDIHVKENMLICLDSWGGQCTHIARFTPDGDGYRLLDAIDFLNQEKCSSAEAAGWMLNMFSSMLNARHFEWEQEDSFNSWLWHSPPRQPRRKLARLAKRLPGLRTKFQKAFAKWINASQLDLRIPIQLGKRTHKIWGFSFKGIAPQLSASLIDQGGYHELVVGVDWQGQCWDLLLSLEVNPKVDGSIHTCGWCQDEEQHHATSREELWGSHLFFPLLDWVNNKLSVANWLVLHNWDGATAAELAIERPADRPRQTVLALKVDGSAMARSG